MGRKPLDRLMSLLFRVTHQSPVDPLEEVKEKLRAPFVEAGFDVECARATSEVKFVVDNISKGRSSRRPRRRGRRLEQDKGINMLKKLREPVNSLTHWAGAFLALIGLIALLIVGWGTPAKVISLIDLWREPDLFIFGERHVSHGASER